MRSLFISLITLFTLISTAQGFTGSPNCMSHGQPLPLNNEQVVNWKHTSRNSFKSRGHVEGTLGQVYKDATGHRHFQIQIGTNANDTIEVIYNQKFGKIPSSALQRGAHVETCGDYITSNAKVGRYGASPDGAIIHWVHESSNDRHDSGYVMIDGQTYGYGTHEGEISESESDFAEASY
jgi:hypothetical protein